MVQNIYPIFIDTSDEFMEIVRVHDTRKYLGNTYSDDLRRRGATMVKNRIRFAWSHFYLFGKIRMAKNTKWFGFCDHNQKLKCNPFTIEGKSNHGAD